MCAHVRGSARDDSGSGRVGWGEGCRVEVGSRVGRVDLWKARQVSGQWRVAHGRKGSCLYEECRGMKATQNKRKPAKEGALSRSKQQARTKRAEAVRSSVERRGGHAEERKGVVVWGAAIRSSPVGGATKGIPKKQRQGEVGWGGAGARSSGGNFRESTACCNGGKTTGRISLYPIPLFPFGMASPDKGADEI
eukprot:RCo009390